MGSHWFLYLIGVVIVLIILARKKQGKSKDLATGFTRYRPATKFEHRPRLVEEEGLSKAEARKRRAKSKKIAVLRFSSDENSLDTFSEFVDEVIVNKEMLEEVVVVIDSPGGAVHLYGDAFAQMERLRSAGLTVTACVDRVAASGGYLMALPANRIIAAPFAVVGSIGVVAMAPNLRQLAERLGVNPRVFTSGRNKRTVHYFDDDSKDVRDHFQEQLTKVHDQFLRVVQQYRPKAKLDEVREADHWLAQEAVDRELGLVDELGSSASYLLARNAEKDLVEISRKEARIDRVLERFGAVLLKGIRHELRACGML